METKVTVQDEDEALLLQTGLQDAMIRTFVKINALLLQMPDADVDKSLGADKNMYRKLVLHSICCLYGCDE